MLGCLYLDVCTLRHCNVRMFVLDVCTLRHSNVGMYVCR